MKNVTISLPEVVARQARLWAAEADMSVSKFLAGMLEERMQRESTYQQARDRFLSREPILLQEIPKPYPSREQLHDRTRLH